MKRISIIVLSLLIAACSGEEETPKKMKETEDTAAQFQGVETLFDQDAFEDPKHVELLKELKICSEFQKDTSNYLEPACSPRFFRILPMRDDTPVENAFLLQIKSKVGGIKLRRLVTFVRERGELVKVNTFVANLIGTRKSKTHYNDLILRFNDNIDGEIVFYNCIFSWDGTKYKFQTVELIEGATWRQRLKPEFKDSVSNDIYQTLLKNEMII
jgi:hypothetical protein